MQASLTAVSVVAFLVVGFVVLGGPMILVDWLRRRRQMAIERQVALTDALDGRFGALVAPVVRKALIGPWEIQLAVAHLRSTPVARILSVVDDVFTSMAGGSASSYRIILSAKPDSLRGAKAPRSIEPWAGGPIAAA